MKNILILTIVCLLISLTACSQKKEQLKDDSSFNPPKNIQIKRTYAMKSSGVKIGKMESTRQVDTTKDELLIKDIANSLVGLNQAYDSKANETFWISKRGVEEYNGKFTDVKNGKTSTIDFKLEGDVCYFNSKTPSEVGVYRQEFIRGKDYHWCSIYVDPTNRELKKGKEYKRGLLDVSFARTMKLKEKFLRMDKFKLGKQVFDCYVLYMDYGHVKGEIWIAKDELGWFLVYEDAIASEGPFELILDGYTKTELK